ncbi:hypothetical protein J6590_054370 [Homalodisca vitripennis]|nr:hypothetical protein J6590_054370 [Homalodisca vitripennis]
MYFNPTLDVDSYTVSQMMIKIPPSPDDDHYVREVQLNDDNVSVWKVQQPNRKAKSTPESIREKEETVTTSNRFQVLEENEVQCKTKGIKYDNKISKAGNKANKKKKETEPCLSKKVKLSLFADSQGRYVQKFIEESCKVGEIEAVGFVYPNARLLNVVDSAKQASDEVIVIMGGTNDSFCSGFKSVFTSLEKNLVELSENKTVLITSVPRRFDADIMDPVHLEIDQVNSYIGELTNRIKNMHFIDLDVYKFKYFHFSKRGLT